MDNRCLTIKVPGKLMIAGEYAVLEPGYPAVVIAVNRYITIRINHSKKNILSFATSESSEVSWIIDENNRVAGLEGEDYAFIREAIETSYEFLKEKGLSMLPFEIHIRSELMDQVTGKKYGLGSSAAIVVGVIRSILLLHNQDIQKEPLQLFKLACLAHLKSQGNGSGADIAACVFGGWLLYSRYDVAWLTRQLNQKAYSRQEEGILKLITMPWPSLRIERILPPSNVRLFIGWTKYSAQTAPMIERIEIFQKQEPIRYGEFLARSKNAVNDFIRSCKLKDGAGILHSIHENRKALQYLSDMTKVPVETKEMKTLCDIADWYGRGKSSGAGGGDCGIAFLLGEDKLDTLKYEWEQAGIMPLHLLVAESLDEWYNDKN